ncbi:hypothetical protein AUC69_09730 [Methyloceanibacter superfactus]|uniref:SPW repeat-containing integral membrane domain-containing protein n=1 Tax=Methyloceanibacter superfactus TaxID=1774969 RepID=A0A1E3VXE6_9HYPH|nr:hypothetical protein [Methyloceanibacter superfactus]ODR98192.1 hypothetical protein AUC69_09730 [Methyloceanibacter superfactus]
MDIRFLTPRLHGIVDYLAAASLLTLPVVLGLGETHPLAKWLSVGTGAAVVIVSLLTDYRYGAFRVLPFRGHLAIDAAAASVFALAPAVFGFTGLDAWYYWLNAVAVFAVVGLSTIDEPEPAMARV